MEGESLEDIYPQDSHCLPEGHGSSGRRRGSTHGSPSCVTASGQVVPVLEAWLLCVWEGHTLYWLGSGRQAKMCEELGMQAAEPGWHGMCKRLESQVSWQCL